MRVLIVSTMVAPEVVEQLDSEKVVVATEDEDQNLTFRKQDAVGQFEGEIDEPPRASPSK